MAHALMLLLESPVLIAAIFISGIGGTFQFGFHISVLTSPSSFIKELVNTTCLQRYSISLEQWEVTLIWSFIVSIFCIGGLLGSLCAGHLSSAYGRKRCLLLNNLFAIGGAVMMLLSKTAMSFEMIMVGRFLYGINAGVSLSVHTMYLVECAPKRLRGIVGLSVATFLSMGKFSGQLLGISELLGTEDRWPWLLGFSGATALLQLITLPFLPESPKYLLLDRGDRQGCEKGKHLGGALRNIDSHPQAVGQQRPQCGGGGDAGGARLHEGSLQPHCVGPDPGPGRTLAVPHHPRRLHHPAVQWHQRWIPTHQLRHVALGTGLCEVSTSMACVMVIESTGKRLMLYRGYLCMAVTLGLLTLTLYLQIQVSWMPYCSMLLIFIFIFFFSSGPAGVTVALPGDIFNQSFKSAAYTIGCTLNWLGLFLLGLLFPVIVENLDYFCFLIFFVFCFLSGVFVWYNVPETKNRTVMEITAEFQRMHPNRGSSGEGRSRPPEPSHIKACTTTKF
ncbi:solute carrier family 2, facilitated glucose transporter member 11-like isoform 2-T2 [Salvelinus alpinus]